MANFEIEKTGTEKGDMLPVCEACAASVRDFWNAHPDYKAVSGFCEHHGTFMMIEHLDSEILVDTMGPMDKKQAAQLCLMLQTKPATC